MKNIGIILELENGGIKESNFSMITLARQNNTTLFAFVMNQETTHLKEDLEAFGITTIVRIDLAEDLAGNPGVEAQALANAIKAYHIQTLFGLSTAIGKDLLPRVAAILDAPLVMDCISVDLDIDMVKTSQYSGKTLASISVTGDVKILGIRSNVLEPVEAQRSAATLIFDQTHLESKGFRLVKAYESDTNKGNNLMDADIIISGGRGMKNSENFILLFQCAKKLNAAVGASRVAVDSNWVPYSMQVGQTGEKVSPRVYIACGISGSIQHFAGMKTAGMVIALNTDENAAIISNADYFVIGDALEIIPELTRLFDNG